MLKKYKDFKEADKKRVEEAKKQKARKDKLNETIKKKK